MHSAVASANALQQLIGSHRSMHATIMSMLDDIAAQASAVRQIRDELAAVTAQLAAAQGGAAADAEAEP
jgi:hypothetical protein